MPATTPTSTQEKTTIVCIDDEPEMLRLIRLTLGRRNFELATAEGGREGLELVRRLKPQLVLLDLMLPDLDGWAVYQQMKIDEELKHIPVIVVTAKDQSIGIQPCCVAAVKTPALATRKTIIDTSAITPSRRRPPDRCRRPANAPRASPNMNSATSAANPV